MAMAIIIIAIIVKNVKSTLYGATTNGVMDELPSVEIVNL
jgi:hypothetical protein